MAEKLIFNPRKCQKIKHFLFPSPLLLPRCGDTTMLLPIQGHKGQERTSLTLMLCDCCHGSNILRSTQIQINLACMAYLSR